MRFARLAPFIASAVAAPAAIHTVEIFAGETTGKFLVTLKPGVPKSSVLDHINATITHDWQLINGFAGYLDRDALSALRANPSVQSIAEDGILHTMTIQTNAPWGLSRLSSATTLSNQDTSALTFSYTWNGSGGSGVDIFIVDTGIFTAHSQFRGRASWGGTFGPYDDADGNGHGTHCAGTAAGSQFGVAKSASLVAVKVLSDVGSGAVSDIISGLNFVAQRHSESGRPSVASMSFGGSTTSTVDDAVASLTSAGVHVVVSAGNNNTDANGTSPARAPSANTVGASTINDARASFSNFGSVVDIFAPGENVISSWIGSTAATNTLSGTSMAAPHVAGLIAYLIGVRGPTTPDSMTTFLNSLCQKDVLTGLPAGTTNCLAHNDIQSSK